MNANSNVQSHFMLTMPQKSTSLFLNFLHLWWNKVHISTLPSKLSWWDWSRSARVMPIVKCLPRSISYGTLTFIVEVHKLFVAIWIYTKKKQLIMSIYFRWNCSQAVTTARHTVLFEDNCFWYVYPQAVDAKFRCENILRMSKDFATRSVDNIAATDAD